MVTPRQGIAMFSIAAVLPLLVLGLQENKPGTDPANREGPVMRVEVNKLANSKRELASPMQRVKIAFVDEDRLSSLGLTLPDLAHFLESQPFLFAVFTNDDVRSAANALKPRQDRKRKS